MTNTIRPPRAARKDDAAAVRENMNQPSQPETGPHAPVEKRASELQAERVHDQAHALEDWLNAEREIRGQSVPSRPKAMTPPDKDAPNAGT